MANIHYYLSKMVELDASDLHITVGSPAAYRVHGEVTRIGDQSFNGDDTKQLCYGLLSEVQRTRFEQDLEIDFSFGIRGLSRFRANVFVQRGAVAAAIRRIPFKILTFDELGLPEILEKISARARGLVLVTGPTGSGKSTTLAAMIDKINSDRREHIITIEDPIEFLHTHKSCIVNQRELNADTRSFAKALKSILRQDPDIVLIGELRDPETIELALTISETGHLTFGTLHTNSAVQTIHRVIDVFPPHQQSQIRAQLSFVLEGVVSQQLIKKVDNTGRSMALEVMTPNSAIRNLIREDKLHQVYSMMQTGQQGTGMMTMSQSLVKLYHEGYISYDDVLGKAVYPDEVAKLLGQQGMKRI